MPKQERNKRLLLKGNSLKSLYRALFAIGLVSFCFIFYLFGLPTSVNATAANEINFQARLEQASGAIVADGNYNITFHIFNASTSSGSTDTGCGSDGNCLWEESYTYNSDQAAAMFKYKLLTVMYQYP